MKGISAVALILLLTGMSTLAFDIQLAHAGSPPVAILTYSPELPEWGEPVTFDASDSYDPDGWDIERYEWDFGDGEFWTTFEPTVTHTYASRGLYHVWLIIWDVEGDFGYTSFGVDVFGPWQFPPVASFTYSPEDPAVGETVHFDASASYDPDYMGSILYEYWGFGDGDEGLGRMVTHVYAAAGTYTVHLTVIDESGSYGDFGDEVVVHAHVDVDLVPDTLNLKSEGQWITAYIQLPAGYPPEDIDATTILLDHTVAPILDPRYDFATNPSEYLVDHNTDGILERMVKFDSAEVMSLIRDHVAANGWRFCDVALTLTGELLDGTQFEGDDVIRVIVGDVNGDHVVNILDLAEAAMAYGSAENAPSYDWNMDLNEDGIIDILDLSIIGRNYGNTY
ncbi:MAG: PKD domain-containing protein [Candidatus Bathyarchaeota archaeon]|nr:PKD domain-containing protein [Candidatus Bathyarchaeota archaeon]